jgi:hypothetical protein
MAIRLGSKLRVNFTFQDEDEEGTLTPIDLSTITTKSVRIIKPDGTELTSPELVVSDAAAGRAYWDAAAGVLDQPNTWNAQGLADGFISDPVTWNVERNP